MPIYHKLGKIPPKKHTQFRKPSTSNTEGVFFTNNSSERLVLMGSIIRLFKWYFRKNSGKSLFVIQKESLVLIFVHKRDSF
jgi:hypothetical protein